MSSPAYEGSGQVSCRSSPTSSAVTEWVSAPTLLESSGGLALANARAYAATGVDFLPVGALTHSGLALDLGLDLGPSAT